MEVIKRDKYYFIKNIYFNELKDGYNTEYIFDSNVTIDVASLYYKINTMNDSKKEEIKDLILYLKKDINVKIDYKYSLTELSCDYSTGNVNEEKYNRLKLGLKNILNKNEKQLIKHCKYGKVDKKEDNNNSVGEFGNMSNVINNAFKLLFYAYVPLGEMFLIINDMNKNNRIQCFKKYTNILDEKVKMIGGYELAAGVFYMLNNEEELNVTQKLIKATNNIDIIKKVWNVAWDITFLRLINENSRVLLSGDDAKIKRNSVLVTKDKELAEMAKLLNMGYDVQYSQLITGFSVEDSKVKSMYRNEYTEIIEDIMCDEKYEARVKYLKSLSFKEQEEHFRKLTDNITEELKNKYN